MDGAFPSQKGQYFNNYSGTGSYERGRGFRGSAENAKTKLCNRWQSGECTFGDRCNFAHGEHELRALPPRDLDGSNAPGGRGGYSNRGGRGAGYSYGGRGPAGAPGSYSNGRGRGGYDGYYQNAGYGVGNQQGGYAGSYGMEHSGQGGGYGPSMGNAREGSGQAFNQPIPGPNGWFAYRSEQNEVYFHHSTTNATQWEPPSDWINPPK